MNPPRPSPSPIPDLVQALQKVMTGEVRTDLTTRLLYSTDASIYQIEPYGVIFPKTADDLLAAIGVCASFQVPMIARGAGSGLAGQAIGPAMILDCSRYLNRILEINPETRTAVVEPGVVLAALNRAAAQLGLQFGPDPASAERATLGGSISNNASGAHSIQFGMAVDHICSADVAFSDGSIARLEAANIDEIMSRLDDPTFGGSRLGQVYQTAFDIRNRYGRVIRDRWPRTWRTASGYPINYLLPWAAAVPPLWSVNNNSSDGLSTYPPIPAGQINLATLMAGSEGTLAVLRKMTVRLVPIPKHTVLGVLAYGSIGEACDAVPDLLTRRPAAIELIPASIIQLARAIPAYADQLGFIDFWGGEIPAALLVMEFSGDDPDELLRQTQELGEHVYIAETKETQRQVWGVRKVGLGILMSLPGDVKPLAFIEDLVVPVDQLGEFIREMERILEEYGTHGEIYAHASAGCLHIRPLLSLKTAEGVKTMRAIAGEAVRLTLRLGGSVSGEHGDGLSRSEWLAEMYGPEILQAFREVKHAFDPSGLLNPGKILDPQPMDQNLRFGPDYKTAEWKTRQDFERNAGLSGAIEQCNGAGVCRKEDGVMCPSFQATQDEMHSTRGRANLLRALISGRFPSQSLGEKAVYEALDLCLACKGCKAECPSAVDMAKLKYEFTDHYYQTHRHNLRDYLFAYIGGLGAVGQPLAFLGNPILNSRLFAWAGERWLGLSKKRPLPKLAERSFLEQARKLLPKKPLHGETVLLLVDAFTEYFQPEAGVAALQILLAIGCQVKILPVTGAGRTLISKGFLLPATRHANRLVEAIARLDPTGKAAIVGIEPSEILTLRDEYLDLLPDDARVPEMAARVWMIDEYLIRPRYDDKIRLKVYLDSLRVASGETPVDAPRNILLHGHCYQKAQPPAPDGYPIGVGATTAMLKAAGYEVETIPSGCCGMAGAFGYESEHYEVSLKVGEQVLLPAVRSANPETIIAACGVSCQAQIEDGTGRSAFHPIQLVLEAKKSQGQS